ncbi:MAG: hypothetical protein IPJ30_23180 [Acidobacteria bacterium]|nr:hypothetical protein [Acidobacteriota bacterium]
MYLKLLKPVVFVLIFLIRVDISSGQESVDQLEPKYLIKKSECPINSIFLQSLDAETKREDLIIIVSHLGKSEKARLGQRRLFNARTFLVFISTKSRSMSRIIAAQGERVPGKGFLDFYVKGELELRIFFLKNRELFVQPCFEGVDTKPCSGEDGRRFYPCRRSNRR